MTPESLLHDFGLPAFLLVVLGTVVYRSTVYVGRRLFDQRDGIVTIVATRHVEFLDNLRCSLPSRSIPVRCPSRPVSLVSSRNIPRY